MHGHATQTKVVVSADLLLAAGESDTEGMGSHGTGLAPDQARALLAL